MVMFIRTCEFCGALGSVHFEPESGWSICCQRQSDLVQLEIAAMEALGEPDEALVAKWEKDAEQHVDD
jgi:hypothetical protein